MEQMPYFSKFFPVVTNLGKVSSGCSGNAIFFFCFFVSRKSALETMLVPDQIICNFRASFVVFYAAKT